MELKNINYKKLKSATFKLCIGTVLGVSILTPNIIKNNNNDFTKYRVDTTQQQSETYQKTGNLEIYFKNKEYLLDKEDYLSFFDDEKNGYGIVESTHDNYVAPFTIGKYKFRSNELGYGDFEIKENESTILIVDYKNKTVEVTNYLQQSQKQR